MAARRKARITKRHKKIRSTCLICGKKHSTSKHIFHGKKSYVKSHSPAVRKRARAKAKRKR